MLGIVMSEMLNRPGPTDTFIYAKYSNVLNADLVRPHQHISLR